MRDARRITHQVGFTSVVWSSDGTTLYASGQYSGEGLNPVYRWKNQGRDAPEKFPSRRTALPKSSRCRITI